MGDKELDSAHRNTFLSVCCPGNEKRQRNHHGAVLERKVRKAQQPPEKSYNAGLAEAWSPFPQGDRMCLMYSYPENKSDHGRVFPPQAQVRAVFEERWFLLGREVFSPWSWKTQRRTWAERESQGLAENNQRHCGPNTFRSSAMKQEFQTQRNSTMHPGHSANCPESHPWRKGGLWTKACKPLQISQIWPVEPLLYSLHLRIAFIFHWRNICSEWFPTLAIYSKFSKLRFRPITTNPKQKLNSGNHWHDRC